jgi:hypothetical protein
MIGKIMIFGTGTEPQTGNTVREEGKNIIYSMKGMLGVR